VVRPGLAHYASAKGAIRQLVRGMAVDLAEHGIRVNAIAPGPTLTPANREFFARTEVAETNLRLVPLGRVAEPREMVGAAVFLASDEAGYVTGTTLFVDGGYVCT
jgi:glucose 1-dehydrogenase